MAVRPPAAAGGGDAMPIPAGAQCGKIAVPIDFGVRSLGAPILLDSADQRSQLGRFSMLCAGPLRQLTSSGNPATDQQHLRALQRVW